jgi:hypothetical protein
MLDPPHSLHVLWGMKHLRSQPPKAPVQEMLGSGISEHGRKV